MISKLARATAKHKRGIGGSAAALPFANTMLARGVWKAYGLQRKPLVPRSWGVGQRGGRAFAA